MSRSVSRAQCSSVTVDVGDGWKVVEQTTAGADKID
jgi:hypothetical protein